MSQRTVAGLVAAPVVLALLLVAFFAPLPYVVYRPGPTINVLGADTADCSGHCADHPIIQVSGHATYPTTGQLRMVTVSVTEPNAHMSLAELLPAWFSRNDAVYPWDAVYSKGTTEKQSKSEGAAQMTSSQDNATAVALTELGDKVPVVAQIASVLKGAPADGELKTGDLVLAIDGTKPKTIDDLVAQIKGATGPLDLLVQRKNKQVHVSVTPQNHKIGVSIGAAYDFPFHVQLNVDPSIGGPSAGLMFSLAIYDTLTPGSLTGGNAIAGTGEIESDGSVGPIGGIQQKIAGARRDGAKLFLVPKDNCVDAKGADNGSMRLVRVDTMHDAVTEIGAWVKDHHANLPSCS